MAYRADYVPSTVVIQIKSALKPMKKESFQSKQECTAYVN